MKKILAFFLMVSAFFVFQSAVDAAPKKKKPKTLTRIEFETSDHFLIVGDLYFAKQKNPPRPLVVLLHSYGLRSSDFAPLARVLREKNYNVLVPDLRGHGRSVHLANLKFKSKNYFKDEDWARLSKDTVEAIEFIGKNYTKIDTSEVYFVGADIGASAAVLAADRMKTKPKSMVLVSPFLNFKGLNIAQTVPKLKNIPMMVVASRADKSSFANADIVASLAKSQVKTDYYNEGGSGLLLLKRNPLSYLNIVNFIISGK